MISSASCQFRCYFFFLYFITILISVPFTTNLDREFVLTFPQNPADKDIELLIQTPVSDRQVVVNIQTPRGVEPVVNLQEVVTSTTPKSVILPRSLRPTAVQALTTKPLL